MIKTSLLTDALLHPAVVALNHVLGQHEPFSEEWRVNASSRATLGLLAAPLLNMLPKDKAYVFVAGDTDASLNVQNLSNPLKDMAEIRAQDLYGMGWHIYFVELPTGSRGLAMALNDGMHSAVTAYVIPEE